MSPEKYRQLIDIAEYMDVLSTTASPKIKQIERIAGEQRKGIARSYAEQGAEAGVVSSVLGGTGTIGRLQGIANTALNYFYRVNALDQLALSDEALSFTLSDDLVGREC